MDEAELDDFPWFCTQCRDHVEWEDLDMVWFEAGTQKCVMCAKGNPYPGRGSSPAGVVEADLPGAGPE